MAHFAKLDENNIVVFVTVGRQEDDGKENELTARTGDVYKQTSYNTRGGIHYNNQTGNPSEDQSKALRKNYAGIGYFYDPVRDAFISPKPFNSWILEEDSCLWQPPVQCPEDGKKYIWNEASLSWLEIQ
jgi:hypothetical protein